MDIGAGTAELGISFLEKYINMMKKSQDQLPSICLISLDPDIKMLSVGKKKLEAFVKKHDLSATVTLKFILGLSQDLEKKYNTATEGTIDVVTSAIVFHHINEQGKRDTFNLLFKAMTPGGKVIIGF